MRVRAEASSVSLVRDGFGELGLPPALLEEARLLVSELVANSIRHSVLAPGEHVRIRADWSGRRLRVDVFDRADLASARPVAGSIRPTPDAESGWGLFLVDRVAERWGNSPGRYWFELDARTYRPAEVA